MVPVTEFALEQHEGPYERWPWRTRLLRQGLETGIRIRAYALRHQFEVAGDRVVLVADMDCPWEEETLVLLIDRRPRILSKRHFGLPFGFFGLTGVTAVDDRRLELDFGPQGTWRIVIRDTRPWIFGSLLGVERLTSSG